MIICRFKNAKLSKNSSWAKRFSQQHWSLLASRLFKHFVKIGNHKQHKLGNASKRQLKLGGKGNISTHVWVEYRRTKV
jgi:hypothetical protein